MADKEEKGNRPEVQQRCVENGFSFATPYDAISASCSRSNFEIGSNHLPLLPFISESMPRMQEYALNSTVFKSVIIPRVCVLKVASLRW